MFSPWFRVENIACHARWYASNVESPTGQQNLRIGYYPPREREKEMILVKVDYDQNLNEPDYCKIGDVNLGNLNLIVGLNATGKTPLTRITRNFAKTIMGNISLDIWRSARAAPLESVQLLC